MADRPRPTRRDVLRVSLGLALLSSPGLAGCTLSDPTVDGAGRSATPRTPIASGTPKPTPSPTPTLAGATRSATREQGLAALAAAITAGPRRKQLSKDQRTLLRSVRAAHRAHASVLDPSVRTPRPPKIDGLSLPQSLALLARREAAAATAHRKSALAVSGLDALLFGSMSVTASAYAAVVADSDPPPVRRHAGRGAVPLLTDVQAVQALVGQLHAVVYGYQLAIGRLPVAGGEHGRAVRELRSTRVQRDRLIAWLHRRSADIPAAEPAYVPTVVPRDAASAARLIRSMQVALLPFCGMWLAAAGDADRKRALATLTVTDGRARSWNAPLAAWPGYPRP